MSAAESKRVDLRALGVLLGARGGLTFVRGCAQLPETLGVPAGSATPLAVLNDESEAVEFVLDAALLDEVLVCCHPLHNEATLALAPEDLLRCLDHCLARRGKAPRVVQITNL